MSEYEFTNEQNEIFSKLANALQRFAIIFGLFGVLLIVMAVADMMGSEPTKNMIYVGSCVVGGAVCAFLAFLFLKPVQNFRSITTTKGQDISELLTALGHLNASHNFLRIVLFFFVAGSLIGVVMNTTRAVI